MEAAQHSLLPSWLSDAVPDGASLMGFKQAFKRVPYQPDWVIHHVMLQGGGFASDSQVTDQTRKGLAWHPTSHGDPFMGR